MNEKDTVTIPRDEYDALRAVEVRAITLENLYRESRDLSVEDALIILGFEPTSDGGNR